MRWERAAFLTVLGLTFSAQAQNDVMVDLSVLDGLSPSYIAPAEPMFPVLPEQKAGAVQKAERAPRTIEKAKQKKTKQVKKKTEPRISIQTKEATHSKEEKIVVVDVEPASPVVEEKKEQKIVAEKRVVEEKQIEEKQPVEEKQVVKEKQIEEKQKENLVEPVEIKPVSQESAPTQLEEPIAKKIIEEQQQEIAEEPAKQIDNALENTKSDESEAKVGPDFVQEKLDSRRIIFEDKVSELNPEQIAQIDDIVGRFSNSAGNKVAIYAYNVDDGIDTFRKKRISLNRAIGIRSYLLKQGFKNFSIKVININSDSDKVNTVELEEI